MSASGVRARRKTRVGIARTDTLLAVHSLLFAVATVLALAALVRIRVGLNYSPSNLVKIIAIYTIASLPFFAGGAVISLAISRLSSRVNVVYGADLLGAAIGCLLLLPLLNRFGAPGVVLLSALLGSVAALLFAAPRALGQTAVAAAIAVGVPGGAQLLGTAPFDVTHTKGHDDDRVLFSKWNSFSRIAVYDRSHGDWSLSAKLTRSAARNALHGHRLGCLDSHPSLHDGDLSKVQYSDTS